MFRLIMIITVEEYNYDSPYADDDGLVDGNGYELAIKLPKVDTKLAAMAMATEIVMDNDIQGVSFSIEEVK